MPSWIRKLLAALALSAALLLSPLVVARAATPSPSPTPSMSASEAPGEDGGILDSPDVELDQTRTLILLAGAGGLALLAALVVLIRR